jgi:ATP-binding cassette subfamily B protein
MGKNQSISNRKSGLNDAPGKVPGQKTGVARLLELSGRKKWWLMLSAIAVTIHAVLLMIPYILIFYILKELLGGQIDSPNITDYLTWAAIAIIASFLMMFISGAASHWAAFNILYELRVKIADRLGRLPMGYVGNRSSGELKKILADDVERIETFIAHGIPDTVKATVLPFIILAYLFFVDWRLAAISILPLAILMLIIPRLMGTDEAKQRIGTYHQALEDMNAGIVEFVRAMPVMKIFGQSASAFSKYSGTVKAFDIHVKKWSEVTAPVWGVVMSFLNNALLPVLIFGLYLNFRGGLELSVFFLFLILGVGYIRPAFALASLSTEIVAISHGVTRIDEILFKVKAQTGGTTPVPDTFRLEFNQVDFSYVDGISILKDINFTVEQGSITALVGPSGSGKSTAGQLVARFYDVSSGRITLDGININDLAVEDLIAKVGFVFQDSMMFRQSMYDNILMGMDRTAEQVVAAAKVARCDAFIRQLPNGYDTWFGDKGVHLSGGEQQRIQLARVVLKDAPVLILDEATAFSDPENEHLIMAAVSEMIQEKTVLVIAHRLSTIAEVDQIVVLDHGAVVAKGRHTELLDQSPLYEKMWDAHKRANEFEIL